MMRNKTKVKRALARIEAYVFELRLRRSAIISVLATVILPATAMAAPLIEIKDIVSIQTLSTRFLVLSSDAAHAAAGAVGGPSEDCLNEIREYADNGSDILEPIVAVLTIDAGLTDRADENYALVRTHYDVDYARPGLARTRGALNQVAGRCGSSSVVQAKVGEVLMLIDSADSLLEELSDRLKPFAK